MKKSIWVLMLLMLSACVQLSPAGASVQILYTNEAASTAKCKLLGSVSVSSEDALRNASAALSGDTAVMRRQDVGSLSIIHGDVYRCSVVNDKPPQPKEAINNTKNPTPTEKTDADTLRKSSLCQSKGGVWISGQCVLSIE